MTQLFIISSTQDAIEATLLASALVDSGNEKPILLMTSQVPKTKIDESVFSEANDFSDISIENCSEKIVTHSLDNVTKIIVWVSSDERTIKPYLLAERLVKQSRKKIPLFVRFNYLYEPLNHEFADWIIPLNKLGALFLVTQPGAIEYLRIHASERFNARAVGHPSIDAALDPKAKSLDKVAIDSIRRNLQVEPDAQLLVWVGTSEPVKVQLPLIHKAIEVIAAKHQKIQMRVSLHPGMGDALIALANSIIEHCKIFKANNFKLALMGKVRLLLHATLLAEDKAFTVDTAEAMPDLNTTQLVAASDGAVSSAYGADVNAEAVRGRYPHVMNQKLKSFIDSGLFSPNIERVGSQPATEADQPEIVRGFITNTLTELAK